VILSLKTQAHARFRRDGNDLHYEQSISLKEALLGFHKRIPHLDGHIVDVRSDGVTSPGQVKTVRAEGMPLHNFSAERGDLHVRFTVMFPQKLSKEQRKGTH
jgi:DnaJ-class molecular chaperone